MRVLTALRSVRTRSEQVTQRGSRRSISLPKRGATACRTSWPAHRLDRLRAARVGVYTVNNDGVICRLHQGRWNRECTIGPSVRCLARQVSYERASVRSRCSDPIHSIANVCFSQKRPFKRPIVDFLNGCFRPEAVAESVANLRVGLILTNQTLINLLDERLGPCL